MGGDTINNMQFEWNKEKAASNLTKHGVSFEEAKTFLMILSMLTSMIQTILRTRRVILLLDSQIEADRGRLLIVSYTERGDSIRLISAREVTRTEREAYEEG